MRGASGRPVAAVILLILFSHTVAGSGPGASPEPLGRAEFVDRRNPPPFVSLDRERRASYELGQAIFNTHWVPAGTPDATRIDGLGPLFNSSSCDSCHNNGARGAGPSGDGPLPTALVIQLGGVAVSEAALPEDDSVPEDVGDPRYGHVLNTSALDGHRPEAVVFIRYREHSGRYPDGSPWTLREPRYEITELRYGALAASTVLKPRLAPSLHGAGLLDAVPADAIVAGAPASKAPSGRFGWQASASSLHEQTEIAFAREMGLTSAGQPKDDCTALQADCISAAAGGTPEVPAELIAALMEFQRWLAVPAMTASDVNGRGGELFGSVGCAACHRPSLPVVSEAVTGSIRAYTDLRVHHLGEALDDRDVAGRPVRTLWRTAPLWGVGYVSRPGRQETFLHDGRARTLEEAILWHDGDARPARLAFERLSRTERETLLGWMASL